jgi:hypothetical protein
MWKLSHGLGIVQTARQNYCNPTLCRSLLKTLTLSRPTRRLLLLAALGTLTGTERERKRARARERERPRARESQEREGELIRNEILEREGGLIRNEILETPYRGFQGVGN